MSADLEFGRPIVDVKIETIVSSRHKDDMPPLEPKQLQRLEESIQRHGVREPLVVYGSADYPVLVDGHHRLSIAHGLGHATVPCRWAPELPEGGVALGGNDADDAHAYAVAANSDRRQMNDFQWYEANERLVKIEERRAKTAKAQGRSVAGGARTSERIASQLNMSKDAVKRSKKIKEQGAPELQEQVRTGKKTLKAAAAEIDKAAGKSALKEKAKQRPLTADAAAADGGRAGLIYLDMRFEAWLHGDLLHEYSDVAKRSELELDALAASPAQIVEWYAAPNFILAAQCRADDLPFMGPALIRAFSGLPAPAKGTRATSVIADMTIVQVLPTGREKTYVANHIAHQPAHSYLVCARVWSDYPKGRQQDPSTDMMLPPATQLPLSVEDEDVYATLAAAWPGRALRLYGGADMSTGGPTNQDAEDIERLTSAWEYVTAADIRDRAAMRPGSSDNSPKPKPSATTTAKATASASDNDEPLPTLVEEVSDDAAAAYWEAALKAARSRKEDGETTLWLCAIDRADAQTDHDLPDLNTITVRASPKRPGRVRTCQLLQLRYAQYPSEIVQFAKQDIHLGRDKILAGLRARTRKRIESDLSRIDKAIDKALRKPGAWK